MRSRSISTSQILSIATPHCLSHRYVAFGMLLVLASCSASQTPGQFTASLASLPARGFQIQIHSTQEKSVAQSAADSAKDWWNGLDENEQRGMFGVKDLPVEIKWLDPYYRVRIGHFVSREEARAVLGRVAREFPAAFIVPDTIM